MLAQLFRHSVPQHSGTAAGIVERMDERPDRAVPIRMGRVAIRVPAQSLRNQTAQAQPPNSLSRPFRGDVRTRHSPDFFGVRSEENLVETLSEPVPNPGFEIVLRPARADVRPHIARGAAKNLR